MEPPDLGKVPSASLSMPQGCYLGGSTAGHMCQVPDPGRSPGVTGADQHWSTDFHGMPMAGSLRGPVCQADRGEGVAFLGILLAVHTLLKGTDCPCAA